MMKNDVAMPPTRAEAAGAIHDFNNALQAIGATLRRMETKLAGKAPQDVPPLIAAMQDQLVRAASLAKSAILQEFPDGRRTPLAIAEFVGSLAPQLRALLEEGTGFELVAEAPDTTVSCDPARLESAVRNLVLNARDAVDGQGTVRLRVRRVDLASGSLPPLAAARAGPYAAIIVEDTGCGMSPTLLRRCTEPFVSTKPNTFGTGMGLFQLRAFAEEAAGFLSLESVEARGTTASIFLPCTATS